MNWRRLKVKEIALVSRTKKSKKNGLLIAFVSPCKRPRMKSCYGAASERMPAVVGRIWGKREKQLKKERDGARLHPFPIKAL
jgi:hypothetical protein